LHYSSVLGYGQQVELSVGQQLSDGVLRLLTNFAVIIAAAESMIMTKSNLFHFKSLPFF